MIKRVIKGRVLSNNLTGLMWKELRPVSATHRAWTRIGLCQKPDEANGLEVEKVRGSEGIQEARKRIPGVLQKILARMRKWIHLQFQFPGHASSTPLLASLSHQNYSHSPHKTRHPFSSDLISLWTPHALFYQIKDRAKQFLRTRTLCNYQLPQILCLAKANAKIYRKNVRPSQTDLQFCSKVLSA